MTSLLGRVDAVSLRLFVAVCETGTITGAAERECIVASAISKRIAEMEYWIGTPLLVRGQRGVQPTAAGNALLRHARRILQNMRDLHAEMSGYGDGVRGHVRMLVNRSSMAEFVPEEVQAFTQLHPDISIELEERRSAEVVKGVQAGLADIGISRSFVEGVGLQRHIYRYDHFAVAVDACHPMAALDSVDFEQTLEYDRIGLTHDEHHGSSMQALMYKKAMALGREPMYRIQVTSYHAALRLLVGSRAVAILPVEAAHVHAQLLGIRLIPLQDSWARQPFMICVQSEQAMSIAARQLFHHLLSRRPAESGSSHDLCLLEQ